MSSSGRFYFFQNKNFALCLILLWHNALDFLESQLRLALEILVYRGYVISQIYSTCFFFHIVFPFSYSSCVLVHCCFFCGSVHLNGYVARVLHVPCVMISIFHLLLFTNSFYYCFRFLLNMLSCVKFFNRHSLSSSDSSTWTRHSFYCSRLFSACVLTGHLLGKRKENLFLVFLLSVFFYATPLKLDGQRMY